MKINIERWN